MDEAMVSQVRRFNRTITQRVGALHDQYLARDRPLGQARVLWEIDAGGTDVRSLRTDLELDSGYLSRLLRSLEAAGLVTVGPSEADGRVRMARLTASGRAERDVLDRASNELACSLLEPLDEVRRRRLVEAMAEVEHLLAAAAIHVDPLDPSHPHARHCLHEYFVELDRRFDSGFDPALSIPADDEELRPPQGVLLVATLRSAPVGCAALRLHPGRVADVKRMWVAGSARGLGLGRRLLAELETYAADHGVRRLRLETNRTLGEAIALYRSAGFEETAPFNGERYAHHWFEKVLPR